MGALEKNLLQPIAQREEKNPREKERNDDL
jgi:hypothetical protein